MPKNQFVKFVSDQVRFDDAKILDHIDQKSLKAMNRLGATIRKVSQRSIRKARKDKIEYFHHSGKKLSKEAGMRAVAGGYGYEKRTRFTGEKGGPPRARTSGFFSLRGSITYGYSPRLRMLSCGPVLFSNKRQGGKTLPESLEFGSRDNAEFPFMFPALRVVSDRGDILKALEAS